MPDARLQRTRDLPLPTGYQFGGSDLFVDRVVRNIKAMPAERFDFLRQLPPDWFQTFIGRHKPSPQADGAGE